VEVTTDEQQFRQLSSSCRTRKEARRLAEEGKEGEHCRRRVPVQERQAQEHHQPEVEPILCNFSESAGYREAV
jgi:hypothetical protein